MKLTLIFPIKNQADKLIRNLHEQVLPYYDKSGLTYDIIIVNDHSSEEESLKLENAMADLPAHVHLIKNDGAAGKGGAVKKGIETADSDYVLFMDCDLAADLCATEAIKKDLNNYDAFFASRDLKESVVNPKQTFMRRIIHVLSRTKIRWQFHFKGVSDTQCGFKAFRTSVAKEMVKRQIISGFAFDVEYCYFLQLNGFKIKDIPCIWRNDPDSSVKVVKNSMKFMKDLRLIKKNKKNYILTPEEKEKLC